MKIRDLQIEHVGEGICKYMKTKDGGKWAPGGDKWVESELDENTLGRGGREGRNGDIVSRTLF